MSHTRLNRSRPTRVICVDDNSDVLLTLHLLLDFYDDIECIGCFCSTAHLEEDIDNLQPDLLLLDYNMPGEDALAVLRRIKKSHPDLECILLTGYDDEHIFEEARAAGASRCLTKDMDTAALVHTIRDAAPLKMAS